MTSRAAGIVDSGHVQAFITAHIHFGLNLVTRLQLNLVAF